MLDNLGILVSSLVILIVIIRAAQLDGRIPWYESRPNPNAALTGLAKVRANAAGRIPVWRKPK